MQASASVQQQLGVFRANALPVDEKKAFACNNDFTNANKKKEHLDFACLFKYKRTSGYAFSNFFETPVTLRVRGGDLDGLYTFPSSEHAYQWAVRVYPKDKSEPMLKRWCVGGQYAVYLDKKMVKARNAIGMTAKEIVGSKNPEHLDLAESPLPNHTTAEKLYDAIWKPILLAKFSANDELRKALVATGDKQLVEWSKVFSCETHGGNNAKGFKDPTVSANFNSVKDEWVNDDKWAGNLLQNGSTGEWRAFGFNIMGQYLMHIRANLVGKPISRPWPYDFDKRDQRS